MDILDNLDLKGNQIFNAFLQGTAKKVSSQFTIRLSNGSGQSQAVSFDGDENRELIISAQSIGSINRAAMMINSQNQDPYIKEGTLYIPAIYGPQGPRGPQGVQGIQGLKGTLEEAYYTNEDPMPVSIGGIPEGTTFNQMEFKDLLTKLLYPYTVPQISLSSSISGGVYEFGTEFISINLDLSVTKKSEKISRVYLHKSTSGVIKEDLDLPNGGILSYLEPFIKSTVSYHGVTEDAKGSLVTSNTITFQFVYPVYYGICSSIPTADDITKMTKKVTTKTTITHTLGNAITDERFVIACPPGWNVSKILDGNGFDNTAAFTKEVMNVVGLDGTAQPYNVYYSAVQSQPAGYKLIYS